jgi:hypothetical protein
MKNSTSYPPLGWAALREREGRRRHGCFGDAAKNAAGAVAMLALVWLLYAVIGGL